tara:strand:+ start:968 stop:1675 length:708 start_codon:yes stop_codon:yes gene_type:complete
MTEQRVKKHVDLITAICEATLDIGAIEMTGKAPRWPFASHKDVSRATQQALARHGIWAPCTGITNIEQGHQGKSHYYSGTFEFTWVHNGSSQTIKTIIPGMGQDQGDKAPVKALVMADKYNKIECMNLPRVDKRFEPDMDTKPKPVPAAAPTPPSENPVIAKPEAPNGDQYMKTKQEVKRHMVGLGLQVSDWKLFSWSFFRKDPGLATPFEVAALEEMSKDKAQQLLASYRSPAS